MPAGQLATVPAGDMVAEDRDRPPVMTPRLVLRASSATVVKLADLAAALPMPGSPASQFAPTFLMIANLLTGGAMIRPDEALPDGVWVLDADGRELARGTVEL